MGVASSLSDIFTSRQWRGRRYLVSPAIDLLAVGGAGIIVLTIIALYAHSLRAGEAAFDIRLQNIVLLLAVVVNWPHFTTSYMLLYDGYFKKIQALNSRFMQFRYIFAGIIAPALLIAYLSAAYFMHSMAMLGYAINLMYFTVGWHYCKQGYGTFIMLSVLKGIYYNQKEKNLFLGNAYATWIAGWLVSNATPNRLYERGLIYYTLNIPKDYAVLGIILVTLLVPVVIFTIARKAVSEKKPPSLTAIVSYLSIYYLYFLLRFLPQALWLVAPFFHSTQYLLFVGSYKRNEGYVNMPPSDAAVKRPKLRLNLLWFALASILTGVLAFLVIPLTLDTYVNYDFAQFGPVLFMMLFGIFINTHHYFIDNIIWRKENSLVGKYLLAKV